MWPAFQSRARAGVEPFLVRDRAHLLEGLLGIGASIDRRHLRLAALDIAAVDALDLALLDVAAVRQHERQQIGGARGSEHRPAKAGLHQARDHAAMVDMGVGQQQELGLARIEGQGAVVEGVERLRALEHAAVDEESALRMADPVAGAGHGAGGAVEVEGDAHGLALWLMRLQLWRHVLTLATSGWHFYVGGTTAARAVGRGIV